MARSEIPKTLEPLSRLPKTRSLDDAWTAPIIAFSGAAPALALSFHGRGMLHWGRARLTTGVQGQSATRAVRLGTGLSAKVTQRRMSGIPLGTGREAPFAPAPSVGDFSVGGTSYSVVADAVLTVGRPTSLVIAHASRGEAPCQTITITFPVTISTLSFDVIGFVEHGAHGPTRTVAEAMSFNVGTPSYSVGGASFTPDGDGEEDDRNPLRVTLDGVETNTVSITFSGVGQRSPGASAGASAGQDLWHDQVIAIGPLTYVSDRPLTPPPPGVI